MYKCVDCGTEYKNAVEYCECGNNTFEIVDVVQEKHTSRVFSAPNAGQLVSWCIFATCLLLAICVIFFVGTPKSINKTEIQNENVLPKNPNIPSIDKLWDNTPIQKVNKQEKISTTIDKTEDKVNFVQKILKPVSKPKADVKKEVPKPKTKSKTVTQQVLPKNKETKNQENVIAKSELTIGQPMQVADKNFNTEPVVLQPEVTDVNNPIFINYKKALLEKLFSRFVVSAVQGDGVCVVSFKIDKNGKLTERNFVRQSDNKTLNDTVYYMFMSVPKFSPPPAVYKGDTLFIQVKFINGDYEFSYL